MPPRFPLWPQKELAAQGCSVELHTFGRYSMSTFAMSTKLNDGVASCYGMIYARMLQGRFLSAQIMIKAKYALQNCELITSRGFPDETAAESSLGSDVHLLE